MSSSTASVGTPTTRHATQFERRVNEVKLSKTEINSVIMDYLVSEGYPSAAQKFAREANIQPLADVRSIRERVEIRNAIHSGNIQSAIERINELNPQILDSDSSLHFSLLRLQLIELIRACTSPHQSTTAPTPDITPAIEFAASHLAPRAPTSPDFLEDLERTMALLIFPPDNLSPPLAALLDPALRQAVADSVNKAILSSQGVRRDAKIRNLIRLRAWAEVKAREGKKDIPARMGLGLEEEERNGAGDAAEDGDSPMMEAGGLEPMVV